MIRYGGEEFLIIAQETELEAASVLAERVRERIVSEPIALPNGEAIRTTASIGIASLSTDTDQDNLLSRADEALYIAKAKGRNQVVCA